MAEPEILIGEVDTKTWRLDRCLICGKEIFYLELHKEEQVWHHEDYQNEDHKPVPRGKCGN